MKEGRESHEPYACSFKQSDFQTTLVMAKIEWNKQQKKIFAVPVHIISGRQKTFARWLLEGREKHLKSVKWLVINQESVVVLLSGFKMTK